MKTKASAFLFPVICIFIMSLSACLKDGISPYNLPYFYISKDSRGEIEVSWSRKDTVDYKVYLSAQQQNQAIELQYEIIIGEGLLEGRDFKLITAGNKLTFAPGVTESPIRIAWMAAALDPTKKNTITIRLSANSKNYRMGLPGPDELQRQLVIRKN